MELILKVKKLRPNAKLPKKAHEDDAGIDLYAAFDVERLVVVIPPHSRHVIPTGIAVEIPKGWFGLIKDRSGLASKKGLHVLAGVIDSGYRGEVKVVLYNSGDEAVTIRDGDKIAQMLILPVPKVKIVEVEKLSETDRGEKGFGSTGMR